LTDFVKTLTDLVKTLTDLVKTLTDLAKTFCQQSYQISNTCWYIEHYWKP